MGRIRNRRIPDTLYHMVLTLTNRHVHAQVVHREVGHVIAAAHSVEPKLREQLNAPLKGPGRYASSTVAAAKTVGQVLAQRMEDQGIVSVYWERPGRYHGKIKAFVDAVRETGIRTHTPPPRSKEMPRAPTHVPGVISKAEAEQRNLSMKSETESESSSRVTM